MKNTKKVVLLSIVGFLLMGSYLTLATAQTPPVETAVAQTNIKEKSLEMKPVNLDSEINSNSK